MDIIWALSTIQNNEAMKSASLEMKQHYFPSGRHALTEISQPHLPLPLCAHKPHE